MSNSSIPISSLNLYDSIQPNDFVALVDSASLTTYRTEVRAFLDIVNASGSVISSSWSSASLNSIFSISASFASSSLVSISASWASSSVSAISSSWASSSVNAISASWTSVSISASYAKSSSVANSASFATSASWANRAGSASFANSSSNSLRAISSSFSDSSSFATTASYASSTSTTSGFTFFDTMIIVAKGGGGLLGAASISTSSSAPYFPNGNGISVTDTQYFANPNSPQYHTLPNANNDPMYRFTVSQAGVPSNAKAVILDASIYTSWPDDQNQSPVCFTVRRIAFSSDLLLLSSTAAISANAGESTSNQGVYPIGPDGYLRWQKVGGTSAGCSGWAIRIVGYVT